MLLLLELHLLLRFADRAVFLHTFNMLLPADALLVLLMETQGTQAVARLLAEHGEDCALSSWHMKIIGNRSNGGNRGFPKSVTPASSVLFQFGDT